jgi:cell wall-associated NlpC family hydrolase
MRFLRTAILFFPALFIGSCHSSKDTAQTNTGSEASNAVMDKYATLIGVPEKDLNKKLIHFVDSWYGAPYKWGGAEKTGVDCSHLVCRVYKDVYNKKVTGTAVDLQKMSSSVKESKLKEGDLVFFKIESEKISHVGLYIANNRFVHASVKKGVMINSLEDKYYKKYFYSGGRLP